MTRSHHSIWFWCYDIVTICCILYPIHCFIIITGNKNIANAVDGVWSTVLGILYCGYSSLFLQLPLSLSLVFVDTYTWACSWYTFSFLIFIYVLWPVFFSFFSFCCCCKGGKGGPLLMVSRVRFYSFFTIWIINMIFSFASEIVMALQLCGVMKRAIVTSLILFSYRAMAYECCGQTFMTQTDHWIQISCVIWLGILQEFCGDEIILLSSCFDGVIYNDVSSI